MTGVPIAQLVSLKGRVAVVTGGAQGLGKGIAQRLAEAGADVLIGDRNAGLARETAAQLSAAFGTRVEAIEMDVSDSSSVAAAASHAEKELGGLDIWVNNAGVFPHVPIIAMSDAD